MNSQSANRAETYNSSDKALISACGLYCGACGIYLATQENDSEKILQYAMVLNQSYEATLCDGCGAERKSLHCSKLCTFIICKLNNGVNLCTECADFPCRALLEFKSKMPHRTEILESQNRLKEIGTENWLMEMKDFFSCPECKTVNSAYDLACRKCGNIPGCGFVCRHKDLIENYLLK